MTNKAEYPQVPSELLEHWIGEWNSYIKSATEHAGFPRYIANKATAWALQGPVIKPQYYYPVNGCQAISAYDKDCICWHNEGTGPLQHSPELIKEGG